MLSTGDGLQLTLNNEGETVSLRIDEEEILATIGDPFSIRDVKQEIEWTVGGEAHESNGAVVQKYTYAGIDFTCTYTPHGGYIEAELVLLNIADFSRAIDVTFRLSTVVLADYWWYDIDNRTSI